MLIDEGTTLKQLMEQNWDIGEYLKKQAEIAEKAAAESTRRMQAVKQIAETGSMFSNEIEESERLRAAYDMLTGKAQEFYRVRKDGFTAQEAGAASYDEMYAYLQRCAAEAAALSATEAKIKVQLNENGEIRKAAITYTDQQNRSVQAVYGWYEKLNVLTGETERAFGQIGSTVIDGKLARAAASAKELEQNAKQFQAAYEQTSKSLAQSYLYMQKSGFSEEQIAVVKHLAQQTYQLEASNADITKDVLTQMRALQEQAATTARIVQQDKDKKALAAAEKAEREKVLSINREIASVQKQIRTGRLDDAKLSREAGLLRQQSDELVRQLEVSGKLTDEQRERLKVLDEQLSAIKTQASTMTADKAGSTTAQKGIMASAAQWFTAYQIWHQALNLGQKTVSTMKDVEMSVTEVSRVIDDASFAFDQFTGDIFHLAENYGRSFEDTIDISTRFAQAGYNVKETLSMTRDSLLALNTAELDAKNATQSIIGIMQQWQFEPEKMIGVIDRINKVADNYAITSQDLVDGLLKSSSMAKQANLSFEQTVGILTAMKTASGAAGKEVGNAFKSILAFIQRPDSIKGFEELGIKMIADEATGTLRPMMSILDDMAEKWNGASQSAQTSMMGILDKAGMFSQEMAIAVGAEDAFTAAQSEFATASDKANDAETRQQANLAAGVYRRNYYTALMENFSKVYDIVIEQQDADGYSMQENAKYMGTLEAKYNSLITSLKELAVVSSRNGFMDLAKGALEAAAAASQFVSGLGGVGPLLTGIAGILMIVKRDTLGAFGSTVLSALETLDGKMRDVKGTAKEMGAAISEIGFAGWAGMAVTAIGLVSAAVNAHQQKLEEMRAAARNSARDLDQQTESLKAQEKAYLQIIESTDNAAEKTRQLKEWKEKLAEAYGIEKEALDNVNLSRKTGIDLINGEISALNNRWLADNSKAIEEARKTMEHGFVSNPLIGDSKEFIPERYEVLRDVDTSGIDDAIMKKLEEIGDFSNAPYGMKRFGFVTEDLEQQRDILAEIIGLFGSKEVQEGLTSQEERFASMIQNDYDALNEKLNEQLAIYQKYLDARSAVYYDEFTGKQGGPEDLSSLESYAKWSEGLQAMAGENDKIRDSLAGMAEKALDANEKLKDLAKQANETAAEIQLANELESRGVPETQEGYAALRDALLEAAEASNTYYGSSEMVREAVDGALASAPELAEFFTNSKELAKQAAAEIEAWAMKFDDIDVSALESGIEALELAIAKLTDGARLSEDEMLRLTSLFPELEGAVRNTGDGYYFVQGELEKTLGAQQNLRAEVELSRVATEYLKGATDDQAMALADAVRELQSAENETERFTALTKTAISVMAGFKSGIGSFVGNIASTISQGLAAVKNLLNGAGSNLNIDGYTSKTNYSGSGSGGKSAAEKAAEEARKQAKKKADNYIKNLQKESKARQKYYDDQIKAARKASEAEQKDYEKRIKHLQKLKEESKKYYDEQIKQVKKKYDDEIEALKKVEEERSRARERADIEEEISYWKKRSGVEAMEKIAELEKELSRKEEDWSTDDQIEQLENLRDAEVERLEETRDAMDERYDAEIENLQEQKEAAKEAADARIEQLQEEKEAEKEKYDNWIEYLREISSDSDSTADQILQAIENVKNGAISGAEQISWTLDSLTQKAVRSINNAIASISDGTDGEHSGKTPANTGRFIHTTANAGRIPKSHTGSEIRSGGLVEVAPAEIIVNPEISRGLRRIVERENQIQNFYNQRYSDDHGKSVHINSPLYYIAKQEIADKADLQFEKNDVARALDKALASLT